MAYTPRIKLTVVTEDGISTSEIKAPHITPVMYEAAQELIYALCHDKLWKRPDKRPKKKAKR